MLSSRSFLIAVIISMTLAFLQTSRADYCTIGKLVKDASRNGSVGLFAVGEREIELSWSEVGTYKKAERGDAVAQYEFAKILKPEPHSRDAMPRVATEAFAWAMRSAVQGNADGENYVGLSYRDGDGVRRDEQEAIRWFMKSIEHGSAKAMHNLAQLYIKKGKMGQAIRYARMSAVKGFSQGQVLWGWMHLKGQGMPVDEKKALVWFTKAARQNNPRAMNLLALCYQQGHGMGKNVSEAISRYEEVANLTNCPLESALAKGSLAGIYFEDEVYNDKSLAFKWAKMALQDGGAETMNHAGAASVVAVLQYIVGLSYWKGECVQRNDNLARKWLEKARAGGNANAKAVLREMDEEQQKRKDQELAEALAREAAERKRADNERAARIREKYYSEKAFDEWMELKYPGSKESKRRLQNELDAIRMRQYRW